jgi:hypothetical protein
MPGIFNASAPLELQLTTFSCSVGATFWCLRSLGVAITHGGLQELMVPGLVSPDVGLLDSSGATIARLLRDRFGLQATNLGQVSFEVGARRAGRQPMAIGGRRWHVSGDDHAWRQVTTAGGERGWIASEFLARAGDGYRVANTEANGANLRHQPGVVTEPTREPHVWGP